MTHAKCSNCGGVSGTTEQCVYCALTAATALLGSWRIGGRPVEATDAFLARAPAQPAAPEPSAEIDERCVGACERKRWYDNAVQERVRRVAAESQLAAVRAELLLHCQDANALAGRIAVARVILTERRTLNAASQVSRALAALTPAPSPGAGEGGK
jgi:hypothetical protein